MKLNVGDVELNVEEWGAGEPLLLVHGLGANVHLWVHQIPEFSRRYRTIAVDLRGFGASDKPRAPGAYAVATLAADVAAVLGALGLERVIYLGTSMGGYVGLALALAEPGLCRALVLCHTAARRRMPADVLAARVATLRTAPMDEYGRLVASQALAPGADRALTDWLANMVASNDREAYAAVLSEGLAGFDVMERLGEVQVPTLVIVGEHDRVVMPEEGREMARRIPGARLLTLGGVGHIGYAERPEAFNRAVLEFLEDIGAPRRG
ncbi:MAG: alpha/beta fold hydrolase [Candidatus Binatia bacterium]